MVCLMMWWCEVSTFYCCSQDLPSHMLTPRLRFSSCRAFSSNIRLWFYCPGHVNAPGFNPKDGTPDTRVVWSLWSWPAGGTAEYQGVKVDSNWLENCTFFWRLELQFLTYRWLKSVEISAHFTTQRSSKRKANICFQCHDKIKQLLMSRSQEDNSEL